MSNHYLAAIRTAAPTQAYRDGWDNIYGKKTRGQNVRAAGKKEKAAVQAKHSNSGATDRGRVGRDRKKGRQFRD
jgi:hypothetical protein